MAYIKISELGVYLEVDHMNTVHVNLWHVELETKVVVDFVERIENSAEVEVRVHDIILHVAVSLVLDVEVAFKVVEREIDLDY